MKLYQMKNKPKLKQGLEVLKQKKIVFENDLIQINKLKNNHIFEYTGRNILNETSIIVGPLQFYPDVSSLNYNKKFLSVDEMTCTYSAEKNKEFPTIHKSISHKNPIVYQLSFIILNLCNDSKMESGIIKANIFERIKIGKYIGKSIILTEHY
jgi:hypothetical protein